jgi:hypothetical protein
MVGSDCSDPGAGGGVGVALGGGGAGDCGSGTGGETPGSWANSRSATETAANAEPPSRIPLYVLQRITTPPNAHNIMHLRERPRCLGMVAINDEKFPYSLSIRKFNE